jgi:hypothetical protein
LTQLGVWGDIDNEMVVWGDYVYFSPLF